MNHHGFHARLIQAAVSICLALTVVGGGVFGRAQSPNKDREKVSPDKMSFEVASIKPSFASVPFPKFQLSPDRFGATGTTATELIGFAYKLRDFQIEDAPEWAQATKFDIEAKVDDAAAQNLEKLPRIQEVDALRMMVQSLLAHRFNLQAKRQTKIAPIYALIMAKGGPKLPQPPVAPLSPEDRGRNYQNISLDQATMAALANFLAGQRDVGRIVEDQPESQGNMTSTYDGPAILPVLEALLA